MSVWPSFTSTIPEKCRLAAISFCVGGEEHTLSGSESDQLRGLQEAIDAADPDVLAAFDADWETLPLLGLAGTGLRRAAPAGPCPGAYDAAPAPGHHPALAGEAGADSGPGVPRSVEGRAD
jgi:hypothetical protein